MKQNIKTHQIIMAPNMVSPDTKKCNIENLINVSCHQLVFHILL